MDFLESQGFDKLLEVVTEIVIPPELGSGACLRCDQYARYLPDIH